MSDIADRASEREEELRMDSIEAWARRRAAHLATESAAICRVCDEVIPLARQRALLGVQTCVACQEDIEKGLIA